MEHVTVTLVVVAFEQSAVCGSLVMFIWSGKRETLRNPVAECDTVPLVSRQVYVPEIQKR